MLKLDSYSTRKGTLRSLNKPANMYKRVWLANAIVLLCVVIDFVITQSIWNTVSRPESIFIIYLITIGNAIALDLPLAIAGYIYKEYRQFLVGKTETYIVLFGAIGIFTLAFISTFVFRMDTGELTFESGNVSGAVTLGSSDSAIAESSDDSRVFIASVVSGLIPLLTSATSFLVTFYSYDPLGQKIYSVQSKIIETEARACEVKAAKEAVYDHFTFLLLRENDMFQSRIDLIDSMSGALKSEARIAIKEKLADPNSISHIDENSQAPLAFIAQTSLLQHMLDH